jgi:polyisoprenyl-phosphate glycosyltransferase
MRTEAITPGAVGGARASAVTAASVEISIIVPVHNEAAGIDAFFAQLLPVLEGLGTTWEVICVNDGSADATLDLLVELHRRTPAIKVISLSRNFGKDVALSAGFDFACGIRPS